MHVTPLGSFQSGRPIETSPASPHPGALQSAPRPSPSCPVPPSRLPPPSRFISHPISHLRPAPCSVPRPRPHPCPYRARFRGHGLACVPRHSGLRGNARSPASDCVWFRVPLRSAATPFGSKAPVPVKFPAPPVSPGFPFVLADRISCRLSLRLAPGRPRLVPVWLPLDPGRPVSFRT